MPGHTRRVLSVMSLTIMTAMIAGCDTGTDLSADPHDPARQARLAPEIRAACARCHAMPRGEYFSKSRWVDEVYRGLRFHAVSPERNIPTPPAQDIIAYFQRSAPERLAPPDVPQIAAESAARFQQATIQPPVTDGPAIAHLSWRTLRAGTAPRVFTCDMRQGLVQSWDPTTMSADVLAKIPHPAHIEWCDLDADGWLDAVISDLGSFQPADHMLGGVSWLSGSEAGLQPARTIAIGLGRVSETRAADVDADGRPDLLVAEFGWQKTGQVLLLKALADQSKRVAFDKQVLDPRHGAIRVPPVDLNADGAIDFVTLFAQEHERIEVFLNDGGGRFQPRLIAPPADPAFGSSGMELCDLDGDGDTDIIASNGDMFDNHFIRAFHGLRWFENVGALAFVEHPLPAMPGVHGCATGDLDLDGDLDIVTGACFPAAAIESLPEAARAVWPSAVWLEQLAPGKFNPHLIEVGVPLHAAHLLVDIDNDGDLDLLLGNLTAGPRPPFTVWENLTRDVPSP